ncbi:MAG: hypothetical protein ACFNJM_09795, partial [Selenomonas artemidis]
SKLFELYIFGKLKKIFTGKREIQYHVKAHYQELDYLLKPTEWTEPYVDEAFDEMTTLGAKIPRHT